MGMPNRTRLAQRASQQVMQLRFSLRIESSGVIPIGKV